MSKKANIPGTAEAWEDGTLGKSDAHVRKTPQEMEQQIDEALGLQAISIRLPKDLIRNYKLIADFHGVGYQPLMRDVLYRFVNPALKEILEEQIKAEKAKPQRPPLIPLKKAA